MLERDHEVTRLLREVRMGNHSAEAELLALVYRELHRIAERRMWSERADHTLQATALVNEAYLRLLGSDEQNWQNRAHFLAAAAQVMRRILVDYARAYRSEKRGGKLKRVDLDEASVWKTENSEETIALDEALNRLATWDLRQSRIVELRFFVGLSEEEIAEVLHISARTVKREWQMARAWLYAELQLQGEPEG